jgi:putative transposase
MSETPGVEGRSLELFRLIERHLNQGVPIKCVAEEADMTERQFYRLLSAYRYKGLAGLSRKPRRDAGGRRVVSEILRKVIEGLCLQKPKPTLSWVHRKVHEYCTKEGIPAPSYSVVWRIYEDIPGEHKVFAHEGDKAYKHEYGIIHRWSASAPNEIWQCDHKQLSIFGRDLRGRVGPLWLTAVEDDYSRAVMGYYLGIEAPSSKRVAISLRQAIWYKSEEAWPVCGIPEKFFSDSVPRNRIAMDNFGLAGHWPLYFFETHAQQIGLLAEAMTATGLQQLWGLIALKLILRNCTVISGADAVIFPTNLVV